MLFRSVVNMLYNKNDILGVEDNIIKDEIVETRYYGIDGKQYELNTINKGIIIRKDIYQSGKQKVSRVVNK